MLCFRPPPPRCRYPDYDFITDNDISKSASPSKRYSEESLRGVIIDIELLSQTDFLVCTFSSQVRAYVRARCLRASINMSNFIAPNT